MKASFYERHRAAIQSGIYPEGMINGFRKGYHAAARAQAGWSNSSTAAKVTLEQCQRLIDLIALQEPRVTAEQCAKGLAYLQKYRRKLGVRELHVIDNLDHFRLIGFNDQGRNGVAFLIPVYLAVAKDGKSFGYCAASWQSGGNGPEINS